jgi:uncharacterized membrane protein YjjP (DUF1212 family)
VNIEKLLGVVADIGALMLESGAETFQVEQTINRICRAFGVKQVESFALPTGIMITIVEQEGESRTMIRRVSNRSVDLAQVSKLINIAYQVREIETVEDLAESVNDIKAQKKYNPLLISFFSSITAGFFALFFGGSLEEFFIALLAGATVRALISGFERMQVYRFFTNMVGAIAVSFIAFIAGLWIDSLKTDVVIAGSIMLLVPGLVLVNSIRDIIAGDLAAGVTRLVEAVMLAGGIAIGTGIVLRVWMLMS